MLATYPSQPMFVSAYERNTNQAGAPLPGIPRRTSSFNSPATPLPIRVTVQAPSPPHLTSDRSSSSSSTLVSDTATLDWPPLASRPGHGRTGSSSSLHPPELSTPVPDNSRSCVGDNVSMGKRMTVGADESADEDCSTPRPSRIIVPVRSVSTSAVHQPSHHRSQTISVSPSVEAKLILKKSGQPLKSSLKSSKATPRAGLSVLTFAGSPFAKSEPTTPTHSKNVHFDAKLEHVKLFLAEQKPLAVSRDGSPTDDTSGTDSDFPSFIYGSSRDKQPKLTLTVRNMPSVERKEAVVVLDDICVSADSESIVGRVRVRNLAFQKQVTIRFTLDHWQTTSEVSGRYEDSLPGGTFDRFGFTIRLNGLLSRIEGREMFCAVRYNVDGKEFWDNNDGQNYHAVFSLCRDQPQPPKPPVPADTRSRRKDNSAGSGSDVGEDLKTKLQEVVLQRWDSKVKAEKDSAEPSFRSTTSLAPRYNFANSFKSSSWKDRQAPKANNTVPWPTDGRTSPTTPPRRVGKQRTPLGSPRDLDGETFRPTFVTSDPEAVPFPVPSATSRQRNHHRGGGSGYFDSTFTPSEPIVGFRSSPGSTTPRVRSMDDMSPPPLSSPRDYPLPSPSNGASATPSVSNQQTLQVPLKSNLGLSRLVLPTRGVGSIGFGVQLKMPAANVLGEDDSTDSTPSIVSPSSSLSSSPSMSSSPLDEFGSNPVIADDTEISQDYRQFVNRFCFYTGNANEGFDVIPSQITRTHSASSIEEFLLSSMTPSSSTDTLRCVATAS